MISLRQLQRLTTLATLTGILMSTNVNAADPDTTPRSDNAHVVLTTADGRTQSIQLDQIWRIRSAFAEGEPRGRTVVDFAFSRLFVQNKVEDVVKVIHKSTPLVKLTAPNGSNTYVVVEKIIDVQKPIRVQHHPKTKAVIAAREGKQQVQETTAKVIEIIGQAN